ncbi:DegT/DnrJ/EryC1/StrS family aminotransferase [Pararobbsia silviterrae]
MSFDSAIRSRGPSDPSSVAAIAEKAGPDDWAVLGGPPAFARALATGQLANRDPQAFFAMMAKAFERRRLSNQGPLVSELEDRLAQWHGAQHCVAFANACFALILSIRALARPSGREVIMPAFTFRGLPHVIRWAGLEPRYCDVDPHTQTLCPRELARMIGPDTAAVLAVDNVNALCDIDALEATTREHDVPLIIDAVYGVGGRYGTDLVGSRATACVFSLHATKLINGFEGGYLTTNHAALADALRSQRTFGYDNSGAPTQLGMNAKLNEIHAALALSNLPHAESIMADNRARFVAYQRAFKDIPFVTFADYDANVKNFCLALMRVEPSCPFSRAQLIDVLRAENALVRPYYSPPLYALEVEAPGSERTALPVTEEVSRVWIQMPCGDGVTHADIVRLAALFRALFRDAPAMLERLRSRAC